MNDKQSALNRVVDIVVECCTTTVNGTPNITRQEVLGGCRKENVVMTRCILVHILISFGYTRTTVAQLLGCTVKGVAHLLDLGHSFIQTSWAFKLADAEATLRCNELRSSP